MTADADEPEGLGAPPQGDELARAVRRSRIANELFGSDEQVRIGRYQLLERVGAGGIGVVWGAWDPELERRVAIKLLKPVTGASRERIVREGQALAKLSHPHVVPIYDVGVHDEQVYLVMEWVRGQTLRALAAQPRSVRQLVDVYRAAGEGLAAAHDAGLIHRDFKPDNAICGDDGRVRVLDFGLARGESSDDGSGNGDARTRGAGTPRYMAPEQVAARAIGPAADQYSFCISLREALEQRDGSATRAVIPGWLDQILRRGTSAEPRDRFGSMHELLRALARDPARVWRRRILFASVAAFVCLAFVLGSLRASRRAIEPCAGAEAAIGKTWNAAVRDKLLAHVRGLGTYGAEEADRLATEIESYGRRWAIAQRETCLAHERRELTEQVYERTLGCVARARVEYDTVIEVLSTASPEQLSSAIIAARGLPAVEDCAFESSVSAVVPPPKQLAARAAELAAEIERARVLAKVDDPDALAATQAAVARADNLGYTPLVARANLAYGVALLPRDASAAIPVLDRAALAAIDAFDDATFVEAFAREVYARSVVETSAPDPMPARSAHVEHVARRSGTAGAFARALLYNNLGVARIAAGDRSGAGTWFDRALAETTVRDRDAELLGAFANRALVTDDPARREQFFSQAHTALARLLGENHMKTLAVRFQAAFFIAHPGRAATELAELCALYERYHAAVAQRMIADCRYELGWLAAARGDHVAARAALSELPSGGALRAAADANVLFLDGKLAEAAAAARTLGDQLRDTSWARFNAADAYGLAAHAEHALGRHAAARTAARAALELLQQLSYLEHMPHYQRRLAHTRAMLARTARPSDAERLARQAADWYRAAGGYEAEVQKLDAIAATGPAADSR